MRGLKLELQLDLKLYEKVVELTEEQIKELLEKPIKPMKVKKEEIPKLLEKLMDEARKMTDKVLYVVEGCFPRWQKDRIMVAMGARLIDRLYTSFEPKEGWLYEVDRFMTNIGTFEFRCKVKKYKPPLWLD